MIYTKLIQDEKDLCNKLALLQEDSITGKKEDLNEALIGMLLALMNDDLGKYKYTSFVIALQDTYSLDEDKPKELFEEVYRLRVNFKNNKPIFSKSKSVHNVYEDDIIGVIKTQLDVKPKKLYEEVSFDFIYNLATLRNVTLIMFEEK